MAWLEAAQMPFEPEPCPDGSVLTVRAWNLMGGLDWAALPVVAEMLGVRDVERLIDGLIAIREFQNRIKD